MNKIELIEKERIEMIGDFQVGLGLIKEEIMLLESVSYKLQEIDNSNSDKPISNSKYTFKFNGCNIVNIFRDERNTRNVNPIRYYGLKNIENFELVKLMRSLIVQYFDKLICVRDAIECVSILLSEIQNKIGGNSIKEFCSNSYDKIISDFYCNYISSTPFDIKELSNKDKKDIITYMINSGYDNNIYDCSSSFLIYRSFDKEEKLRTLILDFLSWNDEDNINYTDISNFINENIKYSFNQSLFLLFKEIYPNNIKKDELSEQFKSAIFSDSETRNKFFKVIDLLIQGINIYGVEDIENTYKEIFDLIKN